MGDKNQIASSNNGQPNNETNPLSTDDDMNNSEQVNKAPKSNPKNFKYNLNILKKTQFLASIKRINIIEVSLKTHKL